MNNDILDIIIGQKNEVLMDYFEDKSDYSIPNQKPLNSSQNFAVKNALKFKASIIQGPPGTGKTQTILAIVYQIAKLSGMKLPHKDSPKFTKNSEKFEEKNPESEKILPLIKQELQTKQSINDIKVDIENYKIYINQLIQRIEKSKIQSDENSNLLYYTNKLEEYKTQLSIKQLKLTGSLNENSSLNFELIDSKTIQKAESVQKLSDSYQNSQNILVCASSNIPVIDLKDKLRKIGLKALQVYAICKTKDYP